MKIVIDIPDNMFKTIEENGEGTIGVLTRELFRILMRGIPLPKGHGNLIDADELIQDIKDDSQLCYFNSWSEKIIHDNMVDFAIDRITDAHIIVEAESEEEE